MVGSPAVRRIARLMAHSAAGPVGALAVRIAARLAVWPAVRKGRIPWTADRDVRMAIRGNARMAVGRAARMPIRGNARVAVGRAVRVVVGRGGRLGVRWAALVALGRSRDVAVRRSGRLAVTRTGCVAVVGRAFGGRSLPAPPSRVFRHCLPHPHVTFYQAVSPIRPAARVLDPTLPRQVNENLSRGRIHAFIRAAG
ncbi:hypothetical protein GCM10027203_62180 [Nonomuraea fastidiosa]